MDDEIPRIQQKIAPTEVKKWLKEILKSLNELHIIHAEELCTGAIFSLLSGKHMLVSVPSDSPNEIRQVSNVIEQVSA
jgi:hypothetical protein